MSKKEKTRRRPTKVQQRAEKMEQILDAAEFLFSKHGLYGVTLKDVAKSVGAHHTLLNYYFVDKKKLFDAVFARRAVVTSTRRMEALDRYDAETHGKPTVEGALRAFLARPPQAPNAQRHVAHAKKTLAELTGDGEADAAEVDAAGPSPDLRLDI